MLFYYHIDCIYTNYFSQIHHLLGKMSANLYQYSLYFMAYGIEPKLYNIEHML
jgi:hypothetical protein